MNESVYALSITLNAILTGIIAHLFFAHVRNDRSRLRAIKKEVDELSIAVKAIHADSRLTIHEVKSDIHDKLLQYERANEGK